MFKVHKRPLETIHSGHFMVSQLDDDEENNNNCDDTSSQGDDNAGSVQIGVDNKEVIDEIDYQVAASMLTTSSSKNEELTSWNDLDRRPTKQQYIVYYGRSKGKAEKCGKQMAPARRAYQATSSSTPSNVVDASTTTTTTRLPLPASTSSSSTQITALAPSVATNTITTLLPQPKSLSRTITNTTAATVVLPRDNPCSNNSTSTTTTNHNNNNTTTSISRVSKFALLSEPISLTNRSNCDESIEDGKLLTELATSCKKREQADGELVRSISLDQSNRQLLHSQHYQHLKTSSSSMVSSAQNSLHQQLQSSGQPHVFIDATLTKLLECMSLYYSSKLTSPKWKSFKGSNLRLKKKIRLNNLIWRAWFLQYIRGKRPPGCQFITAADPDVHKKAETIVLEGKYWRRKVDAIVHEYNKWRCFQKAKIQMNCFRPSSFDWDTRVSNLTSTLSTDTCNFYPDYDMTEAYTFDDLPPMLDEYEARKEIYYNPIAPSLQQTTNSFAATAAAAISNSANVQLMSATTTMPALQSSTNCHQSVASQTRAIVSSTSSSSSSSSLFQGSMKREIRPQIQSVPPTPAPTPTNHHQHNQQLSSLTNCQSANLSRIGNPNSLKYQQVPLVLRSSSSSYNTATSNQVSNQAQQQPTISSPSSLHFQAQPNAPTMSAQAFVASQILPISNSNLVCQAQQPLPNSEAVVKSKPLSLATVTGATASAQENSHHQSFQFMSSNSYAPNDQHNHNMHTQMLQQQQQQQRQLLHHNQQPQILNQIHHLQQLHPLHQQQLQQQQLHHQQQSHQNHQQLLQHQQQLQLQHHQQHLHLQQQQHLQQQRHLQLQQQQQHMHNHNVQSRQQLQAQLSSQSDNILPPHQQQQQHQQQQHRVVQQQHQVQQTIHQPQQLNKQHVVLSPASTSSQDLPKNSHHEVTQTQMCDNDDNEDNDDDEDADDDERQFSSNNNFQFDDCKNEQRRVGHINAEQKRRCNIKNGFDTLKSILPSINQNASVKVSKAAMLQKAAQHIHSLDSAKERQSQEAFMLKKQIEALKQDISNYQSQLPASGMTAGNQSSTGKVREMLDEYVRKRTVENWKFWVFSLLIEPLFNSYFNSVNTSSLEDSFKTIITWLSHSCGLMSLRKYALDSLTFLSKSTNVLQEPHCLPNEAVDHAVGKGRNEKASESTVAGSTTITLTSPVYSSSSPSVASSRGSSSTSPSAFVSQPKVKSMQW